MTVPSQRPLPVKAAVVLLVVCFISGLVGSIWTAHWTNDFAHNILVAVGLIVTGDLGVRLLRCLWMGRNWSRWLVMVLVGVEMLWIQQWWSLIGVSPYKWYFLFRLTSEGIAVLLLLTPSASRWFAPSHRGLPRAESASEWSS